MSAPPGRTRPPKSPASSAQKASVVIACHTCRSKKVKCSGSVPCQYCSRRGLPCSISSHGPRRIYSVKKIAELESRLERYREHSSAGSYNANAAAHPQSADCIDVLNKALPDDSHCAQPRNDQPYLASSTILPEFANMSGSINSPPVSGLASHPNPASAIATESSLSSSNQFGKRVQEVLAQSGSARLWDNVTGRSSPQQVGSMCHPTSATATSTPQLPSEDEAFRLLDAVSLFIGQSQRHYDPREISDLVGLLYENTNDPAVSKKLWYMQVILIFAVGKLFVANSERGGHDVPGSQLFDFAEQNFPAMSVQYANGKLGVELNALMAVYLQMTNRKEEAYLYINSALRLAVLHGYHQNNTGKTLLRSERAQINRLWWTIYMQERRLAAATGTPSSINDDAIDLPLPSETPGLPPASAICANIKIARVTGQIITTLYGIKSKNEEEFVVNAQQIIKDLLDIANEISSEKSLNLTGSDSNMSLRTTASLHLMLYQATLLTIRPLMLYITQVILSGNPPPSAELTGGTLGRLSITCSEAARRLLKVIIALKQRNLVAVYGFCECDAIFSAAFIMLLTKIFDSTREPDQRINPSPGLQESMDMLQYLGECGNTFAKQRLQEFQSLRDRLSAILQVPEVFNMNIGHQAPEAHGCQVADASGSGGQPCSLLSSSKTHNSEEGMRQDTSIAPAYEPWEASMWNNISGPWNPVDFADDSNSMGNLVAGIPLGDSFDQYQSVLNDPDWALTGQDVGDFAELRRHVLWLNP